MSVLKEPLATPSRVRGIYRYLLQTKYQKENRDILEHHLSPNELVKDAPSTRPMLRKTINESLKLCLLVEDQEKDEIAINPDLPEAVRNPQTGEQLLPNTLVKLFFASDNPDEEDFGLVCAWYLAQDIYSISYTWETIEKLVSKQKVGEFIKMSNSTLYGQMDDWMCYMGLAWGHAMNKKRVTVPDPTAYIRYNLRELFNAAKDTRLSIQEFITKLAQKCPLFETGKIRERIEEKISRREPKYLSTSTAFALFRLQEEGYIELIRESDADLMLLPKANNLVDNESRISHIIFKGQ